MLHYSKLNVIRQEHDEDSGTTSSEEEIGTNFAYQALIPKFPSEPLTTDQNNDYEIQVQQADDVVTETMNKLFLDKELSKVDKKILFGIMSKKPEKHLSSTSPLQTKNRFKAIIGQVTPMTIDISADLSQSPSFWQNNSPLKVQDEESLLKSIAQQEVNKKTLQGKVLSEDTDLSKRELLFTPVE